MKQACEDAGVEALGYLPKCADVEIPSRHLGLSLDEDFCFEEFADRVAELVEKHVNINRLLELTNQLRQLSFLYPQVVISINVSLLSLLR